MSKPRKVHTLESLMERTEEYGECRIWTGYTTNKTPQVDSDGRMTSVRRLIVRLEGKEEAIGFYGVRCGTEGCVCPDHIVHRSRKSHARHMAKAANVGAVATNRRIRMTMTRRAKLSKLTMEMAREIRVSGESGPVLAERYGVSRTLVNKVKRGIYWRDAANPFAGLMGRQIQREEWQR